jgi:hypothetical protein
MKYHEVDEAGKVDANAVVVVAMDDNVAEPAAARID